MTRYIVQVRAASRAASAELTYHYDTPLRVGDRVMCPATPYSGGPWLAEVTRLGSDYSGLTSRVLCRVAPDRKRP